MDDSSDSFVVGDPVDFLFREGDDERGLLSWDDSDIEWCPICQMELLVTEAGRCAICGRIIERGMDDGQTLDIPDAGW